MVIVKVIDRDPKLPHQIIIGAGRHAGEISVSCNCWAGPHGGYRPIDHVPTSDGATQKALELYNKPMNHNAHVCESFPFEPEQWGNRHNVEIK